MKHYDKGGLTAGRWYKDNTGIEFRYIGEASSKDDVGLFTDGTKYVEKPYNDFEPNVKETKLFKWFKDGGKMDEATWHNVSFKEWNEILQKEFPEEYKSYKLNDWHQWKQLDRLYFVGKTPKQAIDYFKNWKALRNKITGKMADGGEIEWGKDLGYGFSIGSDVYITDPKSLFRGKTGFVSGLVGKDLLVTIVYNGNERNVVVSKNGVEKIHTPMKHGGEVEIGDIITLKHDLPLASLSDLKGKDLKVEEISKINFASGSRNFYHVTHDGHKYEIDEDFVDDKFKMADGGFVDKTDEELKKMSDDELFAYLDAKAAYMKQYTRPLSAYKAKNFAANAAAVQYQKEGTSKLEDKFPDIEKINEQASKDYKEGIKKIVEKRKTPEELAKAKSNLKQLRYGGKLKNDGHVKFKDKVKAIEKKLLENKKVPKSVQKDYGKTYDKKEAHESASRIAGSMLKKN